MLTDHGYNKEIHLQEIWALLQVQVEAEARTETTQTACLRAAHQARVLALKVAILTAPAHRLLRGILMRCLMVLEDILPPLLAQDLGAQFQDLARQMAEVVEGGAYLLAEVADFVDYKKIHHLALLVLQEAQVPVAQIGTP